MESIYTFLQGYLPKIDDEYPYEKVVKRCCKITKDTYYVMHHRIEIGFGIMHVDRVVSYLNGWAQEAEKSENPALTLNDRFKKLREKMK